MEWETIFTCLYPFTVQTRPLAGTASGMASDSVRSRSYIVYDMHLYSCHKQYVNVSSFSSSSSSSSFFFFLLLLLLIIIISSSSSSSSRSSSN